MTTFFAASVSIYATWLGLLRLKLKLKTENVLQVFERVWLGLINLTTPEGFMHNMQSLCNTIYGPKG